MTSVKLNRNNYLFWARFVEIFLIAKGLDQYLTFDKATETDSQAKLWNQDDAHTMSLMLTSIESSISSTLLYLMTAKAIWERLQQMYSNSGNLTRIYEVCKQYFGLAQSNQSLEEYYTHVIGVCEDWNMYQPFFADVVSMEKQRQVVDVVRFLLGPKSDFKPIHAQILGSVVLPSLPEVFSRLQQATLTDGFAPILSVMSGD